MSGSYRRLSDGEVTATRGFVPLGAPIQRVTAKRVRAFVDGYKWGNRGQGFRDTPIGNGEDFHDMRAFIEAQIYHSSNPDYRDVLTRANADNASLGMPTDTLHIYDYRNAALHFLFNQANYATIEHKAAFHTKHLKGILFEREFTLGDGEDIPIIKDRQMQTVGAEYLKARLMRRMTKIIRIVFFFWKQEAQRSAASNRRILAEKKAMEEERKRQTEAWEAEMQERQRSKREAERDERRRVAREERAKSLAVKRAQAEVDAAKK